MGKTKNFFDKMQDEYPNLSKVIATICWVEVYMSAYYLYATTTKWLIIFAFSLGFVVQFAKAEFDNSEERFYEKLFLLTAVISITVFVIGIKTKSLNLSFTSGVETLISMCLYTMHKQKCKVQ